MGKRGIILSEEDKQRAIANNLSLQTVYARISRGWDALKATTTPPKAIALTKLDRLPTGELIPKNKERLGQIRGFQLLEKYDPLLDKLIEDSGLNQSEFVAKVLTEYIEKCQ